MELRLEELKTPIEVHFADGLPHRTTLQAKDVPFQLGIGFVGFHLRGNGLQLGNGIHHP
jgi:hypothetical protein